MKLVISYREPPVTRFTYTPTECRLKIGTGMPDEYRELVTEFANKLGSYLEGEKYPFSLRSSVNFHLTTNGYCVLQMTLKKGNKTVAFSNYGEVEKLLTFHFTKGETENA